MDTWNLNCFFSFSLLLLIFFEKSMKNKDHSRTTSIRKIAVVLIRLYCVYLIKYPWPDFRKYLLKLFCAHMKTQCYFLRDFIPLCMWLLREVDSCFCESMGCKVIGQCTRIYYSTPMFYIKYENNWFEKNLCISDKIQKFTEPVII